MRSISKRALMAALTAAAALAALTAVGGARALDQQQIPELQPPASQTPLAPAPCPVSSTQMNDAVVLLNRLNDIVNRAIQAAPATRTSLKPYGGAIQPGEGQNLSTDQTGPVKITGGTANTIAISRDKLDEMRAEIAQIRTILAAQ